MFRKHTHTRSHSLSWLQSQKCRHAVVMCCAMQQNIDNLLLLGFKSRTGWMCQVIYAPHIYLMLFHMITPSYYLINGLAMKHRHSHKHTRAPYKVVFSLHSYPRMRRRPTCTYFNTMCHVLSKEREKKFSLEMKVSRLHQPISSLYIWFSSFRYTMQ